jgi:hypothetical protein
MHTTPLRIYCGPSEEAVGVDVSEAEEARETVRVPLGDILPLLVEAVQANRAWPRDFYADEVTIPTDLYELVLAYRNYRRPSA